MYPQGQQPSPTTSTGSYPSRRSPPPSRISPVAAKMSVVAHAREHTPEGAPSPPMQSLQPQVLPPHLIPLPPAGPQHSQSLPSVPQVAQNPHHPRPINRHPTTNFLSHFGNEWPIPPEFMGEAERTDLLHATTGQAGFAYAGGAASAGLSQHLPAAKDPAVERVRATDRSSPKDQDVTAAKRQSRDKENMNARDSPKARERSQTVSSVASMESHAAAARTPEYRGSPQFQTPMASPGERTTAYTQYVPEGYRDQGGNIQTQGPTPPTRKPVPPVGPTEAAPTRSTPPTSSKLSSSHTPPTQAMTTRQSERSLPLQEEPEEETHYVAREPEYDDHHQGSPLPPSDLYTEGRYEPRREHARTASRGSDDDEDDVTLNEEEDEPHQIQGKDGEDSGSGSGFTPRSPSVPLPDRSRDPTYPNASSQYQPAANADYQKTIRAAKHRSGPTDQLGMRGFDPNMFENTVNSLRSHDRDSPAGGQRQSSRPPQPQQIQPQPQPQPQQPQQTQARLDTTRLQEEAARHAVMGQFIEQQSTYGGIHPAMSPFDDFRSFTEDPTSSYIRSFLQTPGARPNAPIPPTPQSNTAAPSPSPLLSAMHSEIESRQIGSPYPYPFTHIRRSTMPSMQQAPSSTPDMNNPEYIREQMARQWQMYALNNGFQLSSDVSTFSPPGTPFPGPGYNPLTFVPFMGVQGVGHAGARASVMSMRSSPSHEPVSLPPPPAIRGRGLRRRDQSTSNLRAPQAGSRPVRRVRPPPRVESTQPRETSPELSSEGSGEETAGEEKFVDHYIGEGSTHTATSAAPWANGNGNGNGNGHVEEEGGEWVDEAEDGEEEDLLELEFHPTYVSSPQRRRRRWETRWDALIQAVCTHQFACNDLFLTMPHLVPSPRQGDGCYAGYARVPVSLHKIARAHVTLHPARPGSL